MQHVLPIKDIINTIQASKHLGSETLQSLWSDYGKIIRFHSNSKVHPTVILKHIYPPTNFNHPRGWNTDTSHQRKIRSYEVEVAFYTKFASACHKTKNCKVPTFLGKVETQDSTILILEDLESTGYLNVKTELTFEEAKICLSWLAHFHGTFLHYSPDSLWENGTYWHLLTRLDELEAIKNEHVKKIAPIIDRVLTDAKYKTFVHGDAKLANFCFSSDMHRTAAVDFQYVGAGCGIKDVAYFIGSILDEKDCERTEAEVLNYYFSELRRVLSDHHQEIDIHALETEWRALYPFAWADFHRFLLGWRPDHWKINSYSQKMMDLVSAEIKTNFPQSF